MLHLLHLTSMFNDSLQYMILTWNHVFRGRGRLFVYKKTPYMVLERNKRKETYNDETSHMVLVYIIYGPM